MTLDKTVVVFLIAPLLGLIIPGAIFFRKLPAPRLTPSEKELISFSSQPIAVSRPESLRVYSGLQNPLRPPLVIKDATAKGKNFPPGSIPTANASASGQTIHPIEVVKIPDISMIYSDGQAHIAIINGHVLREGSTLGSRKVVKIEKTRVLVRTAGKYTWLYID